MPPTAGVALKKKAVAGTAFFYFLLFAALRPALVLGAAFALVGFFSGFSAAFTGSAFGAALVLSLIHI